MFFIALGTFTNTVLAAIATFLGVLAKIQSTKNAGNIEKIEKATNSMKDALVAGAGREGFTAGMRAREAEDTPAQAQKEIRRQDRPHQSNEGMQ